MGYTHAWVPPAIAASNDLTSWKLICQDIHTQMLASGLSAGTDTGQLDITAVTPLPTSGTFAGYKMYQMDDGVSLPIYIKLEFGVGVSGLSTYGYGSFKTLRIRVTIGSSTDGTGTVTGNVIQYSCPQGVNYADGGTYASPTSYGYSFICYNPDRGFLGIMYQGEGGRNESIQGAGGNNYGLYSGSTLTILIQRTCDEDGVPTNTGYNVIYPNLATNNNTNELWNYGNLPISQGEYYDGTDGTVSQPTAQWSRALTHPYMGKTALDSPVIFNNMNGMSEMNCVLVGKLAATSAGQELEVTIATGITQNMMCIGRETGLSFGPSYQRHAAFILWE